MTVEIRELVVHVEVTESAPVQSPLFTKSSQRDEQCLVDMIKQEVLEQLIERGCQ